MRLLVEEMRRVREYGRWKAEWWMGRVNRRVRIPEAPLLDELSEGIEAYAKEHAARERTRVDMLDVAWDALSRMAERSLARVAATEVVDIELEEEEAERPDVAD